MQDFFEISEKAADSISAWSIAAVWALAIVLTFFAVIDAADTFSSSTPWFGLKQYAKHMVFAQSDGEAEAKVLLDFASEQSQLPGIGRVRVWASDRLSQSAANANFNPVAYKITLGESFAKNLSYAQRWVVFHEAGHVAAMLTSRFEPVNLPHWNLDGNGYQAMSQSIVYRQAFSESFADVFASAMALRVDPGDPVARSEIQRAMAGKIDSISLAHDTQPALSIAARHLSELSTLKGQKLLALIDAIASEGAVLTVGAWGAEREAACLGGFWGWSRWATDGAHETTSNPWRMAPAELPEGTQATVLGRLADLTPNRGWKRSELMLAWPAYAKRVGELGNALQGSPLGWASERQNKAASMYGPAISRENAWALALAEYEPASKNTAREFLSWPFMWAAMAFDPKREAFCKGI